MHLSWVHVDELMFVVTWSCEHKLVCAIQACV